MATDEDALGAPDEGQAEPSEEQKPKLSLTVDVKKPNTCQRHVTVTISREDVDRYFDEAFSELMPKAEVPGFRPGRAPRKLIEHRFRKEVAQQIKGTLLMDSMSQVAEDESFSPIGEPDFDLDAVEVPQAGPMTFEFDLEVRPEFDLPDWKGLRLERPVREYAREDVDERLKELRERYGQVVPYDGPAEPGDYLTVDLTFKQDGHQISRIEERPVRIRPVLSFRDGKLEGFDKMMDGVQQGDVRHGKVQLSDGAPVEELRGKELDVDVEVLDVKKVELPELDDKFFDRFSGVANEGELRDAIMAELQRQLAYHQQQWLRQQITESLTKTADWDLPPELLKRQSRREKERAILELRSAGFSEDDILAYENKLHQDSLASTATALKEHFILERIAEEEEIKDEPTDYDKEIALIAAQSGESPRKVRARLEKREQMDVLRNQIIERKTIERITSHARFDEVDFRPEKNDVEAIDFAVSGHDGSDIPEAKPGGETAELPNIVDRT